RLTSGCEGYLTDICQRIQSLQSSSYRPGGVKESGADFDLVLDLFHMAEILTEGLMISALM
ncbi:MAG: hypothetical protein ABI618_19025, partial [Nitrospirota bacterium]